MLKIEALNVVLVNFQVIESWVYFRGLGLKQATDTQSAPS